VVAGVWAEVLGVEVDEVDIEREFAAQGGDSLGWLEVHRRLEEALGRRIALGELIARPTCEAQARWLSSGEEVGEALEGRARQAWRRTRGG
jgi:acyl carrier protein